MAKNSARAAALLEDLKAYNPERLAYLKENTKEDILTYLEKFLDEVDENERQTFENMKKRIPKNLGPEKYAQEEEWKRQQARELAQEQVNSLLR